MILGKVNMVDHNNISRRYNICLFHLHFQISGLNRYYLSLHVTNLFEEKYHLSSNYSEGGKKKTTKGTKAEKKRQRRKVHGHWPPPVAF